jgi:hypothetical protein
VTMNTPKNAPTCHRTFESVFDYPAIKLTSCERLPVPERLGAIAILRYERLLAEGFGPPVNRAVS